MASAAIFSLEEFRDSGRHVERKIQPRSTGRTFCQGSSALPRWIVPPMLIPRLLDFTPNPPRPHFLGVL